MGLLWWGQGMHLWGRMHWYVNMGRHVVANLDLCSSPLTSSTTSSKVALTLSAGALPPLCVDIGTMCSTSVGPRTPLPS